MILGMPKYLLWRNTLLTCSIDLKPYRRLSANSTVQLPLTWGADGDARMQEEYYTRRGSSPKRPLGHEVWLQPRTFAAHTCHVSLSSWPRAQRHLPSASIEQLVFPLLDHDRTFAFTLEHIAVHI